MLKIYLNVLVTNREIIYLFGYVPFSIYYCVQDIILRNNNNIKVYYGVRGTSIIAYQL